MFKVTAYFFMLKLFKFKKQFKLLKNTNCLLKCKKRIKI